MGNLKEEMEKWKLSRYRQPMRETLEKMKEGYEGGVLSFLKKQGFGHIRFSYGNLYVPKKDVDQIKKALQKETEKVAGDVEIMPKSILGEEHDCTKVHPNKTHKEWLMSQAPVGEELEEFDEGRMKDIYTMDQEGKSAKEIAKHLKLKVSTVKSILGEEVLNEFTNAQITSLKKDYEGLRGKTISGPSADKLRKIFDKVDKSKTALVNLLKADIPFLSMMASSRLISKYGANASQLARMRKEELEEAKYHYDIKISSDYGNDGGDQEEEGTLNASSDKDAENKAEKLADKFAELWNKRKKSVGRPGGFDPVEIDVYKEGLEEAKAPFRISYSKDGKHAGFEDGNTLQDIQNKAQKLRAKGFTIDKMGRNTSPVEQKLPEPEGKTEVPETYTVQITKKDGGKLVIGKFKTPAEGEKYITWYKTGDMSKTKSVKVIKEDGDSESGFNIAGLETDRPQRLDESADYLASKMNDKQLANIKNVWKNKKASDVTQSVKDMIKKMDIPTQLAIKQANIPHLSKLVENGDSGDDDSNFAIGMSKAKEIKKDYGSPLKKSTIVKGHEIAKSIKKDEHVGAKATFERLWSGHKRGDK